MPGELCALFNPSFSHLGVSAVCCLDVSMPAYHHEVSCLGMFLRKVAIDYLRHGYTKYALRTIPEGKNLERVDWKIIKSYDVTFCRSTRARRRRKGLANVIYLRYGDRFILMASRGSHEVFDKIHSFDFAQTPLFFDGYTIGVKRNKPCVMIQPRRFHDIRKQILAICLHNQGKVEQGFRTISPFKFPEIIRQKRKLLGEINERRHTAGLKRIEIDLRFTKS